jgi:hypothetical protein
VIGLVDEKKAGRVLEELRGIIIKMNYTYLRKINIHIMYTT